MTNTLTSEKRVFRAAFLPVFVSYMIVALLTALFVWLRHYPHHPPTLSDFVFAIALSITVSSVITVFLRQFCYEVISADGVEVRTPVGNRLHSWNDLAAVYSVRSLRLVYLRFNLASGRSRRILFFQRTDGEFRKMTADLVSRESLIWKSLNDA